MLTLIAKRALEELTVIRAVLNGDVEIEKLPKLANTDGGNRRLVALKLVDHLGAMFNHIFETSALTDEELLHTTGAPMLGNKPEEKSPEPFGFAAGRKVA